MSTSETRRLCAAQAFPAKSVFELSKTAKESVPASVAKPAGAAPAFSFHGSLKDLLTGDGLKQWPQQAQAELINLLRQGVIQHPKLSDLYSKEPSYAHSGGS